jgi:hypothetical protein
MESNVTIQYRPDEIHIDPPNQNDNRIEENLTELEHFQEIPEEFNQIRASTHSQLSPLIITNIEPKCGMLLSFFLSLFLPLLLSVFPQISIQMIYFC